MRTFPALAMVVAFLLSGCSETGDPLRFQVPVAGPSAKVRIPFKTVELREVSLPEYAALSEMAVETEEGGIRTDPARVWADNPVRAVTLELSRNLGSITGATVASEPWPFESFPDARVEVRIEEMLADRENRFRLSGQYFVGALEEGAAPKARVFSLTVPLEVDAGPVAMAAGRGQIVSDLALLIARDGLK